MHSEYNTRSDFVIDMLRNYDSDKPRKILDAGFIGNYDEATVHYNILDSLNEQDFMIGIDIDKPSLDRYLQQKRTLEYHTKRNLRYEVMSIFETSFVDSELDAVLMLEIFEHLEAPFSVVKEVRRILKPGGKFILTYPNPLSLVKMYRFMRQKNLLDKNYLLDYRGAPDHKVFPHPACMANYFDQTGFEVDSLEFIKYDLLPAWMKRINWLKKFSNYIGISAVKR